MSMSPEEFEAIQNQLTTLNGLAVKGKERLDLIRVELNDVKTEVRDLTNRVDDLESDR